MKYNVIGLMSGSSLDGLDIALVEFTMPENSDFEQIEFELLTHDCIPYDVEWLDKLKGAKTFNVQDFLELHTAYGRYLGNKVNEFIIYNKIKNNINLIASHGHTIYHNPKNFTSFQLGEGAQIAAITNIPTVSDLRNIDVALGGQGAPIVPIADKYLFKNHEFCLNIGGIANITLNDAHPIAFDICPANQLLNYFANLKGFEYDDNGKMARAGEINKPILQELLNEDFILAPFPKSLDNSYSANIVVPKLLDLSIEDALATCTAYIAINIANTIKSFNKSNSSLMITGGGAHNAYLIENIAAELSAQNINIHLPSKSIIDNKEAIAMALIGLLRTQKIPNVLKSVTGASINSIGGSYWIN